MKRTFVICLLLVCVIGTKAQKVETIYYDANWKGVPTKELATYKRIVYISNGSQYASVCKSYYITGELQGEATPISVDHYDDDKSLWKGRFVAYYKDGMKQTEGFYNDSSQVQGTLTFYFKNGKPQGVATYNKGVVQNIMEYYESGSIKSKVTFKNGKPNGIYYQYSESGAGSTETEMLNGVPSKYVTGIDSDGNRTIYDSETQKMIQDKPTISNMKGAILNGKTLRYYQMNGIVLYADLTIEKVYGKYYTLSMMIANNTFEPFIFEADKITGTIEKKGETIACKILSSDQYSKIVSRKQGWNSFFNALGEGMTAYNAGTSTSSTTSTSAGYVNSSAIGADNSGNIAVAAGTAYGANVTSSQTTNHNGAAQYQANQNAQQNIAQYDNQLEQYKQALDEGYLKSNTIESGKSITGYINIDYKKGDRIIINIPVNGSIYTFDWVN